MKHTDFQNTFWENLLGTPSVAEYAAAMVLALIGALLSRKMDALKRDPLSPNTPRKFSWAFLIIDNLQKLLNGFLLTFVFLRFSVELLGMDFTMYSALLLGLFSDRLAAMIANIEFKARK